MYQVRFWINKNGGVWRKEERMSVSLKKERTMRKLLLGGLEYGENAVFCH